MMNLIKADIYRILRGKTLYITFGVMLLVVALNTVVTSAVGVTADSGSPNDSEFENQMEESFESAFVVEGAGNSFINGADAAMSTLNNVDTVAYFALPLFLAVAMSMFTCGSVKNELSTGVSRVKLYMSKWILSGLICILIMFFYFGTSILTATLLGGAGDWSGGVLSSFLKAFSGQTLILLAFNSVGLFLTFVIRRDGVIGVFIAFTIVPMLTLALLSMAYPDLEWLLNFELTSVMRGFAGINNMSLGDIIRSILVGVVVIEAATIGGIMLFRKAEIK